MQSGSFTSQVTIQDNGNVGIGTSSPTRTLTVNSGTVNTAFRLESTDAEVTMQFYDGSATSTISGGTSGLIFYPNTTVDEAMRIDSSGRVTMPYQPSFSCYKNGIMTEASGNNRVESWTENHDQGGHFDNSTGRFTAPVSGKYFFAFSAMHSGNVNGDVQYNIYKNGVVYQGSNDTADGGNWDQCTVVTIVDMAANDYVEPYVYSSTTSTRELVYSGTYSGWHGYLIG